MHRFLSPLFPETAIEREVLAVDSEFTNNIKDDRRRLNRIQMLLADPAHDYRKFTTGSKQSLLKSAQSQRARLSVQLATFYADNYFANAMTLSVVGPQSLDELAKLAVPRFSSMNSRSRSAPARSVSRP